MNEKKLRLPGVRTAREMAAQGLVVNTLHPYTVRCERCEAIWEPAIAKKRRKHGWWICPTPNCSLYWRGA